MLNIGKLAAGGEAYYLDTVAFGVEDYYTGAGEAPGYWLTEAAAGLGLTGRVRAEDLRAVLAATDPRSGQRLPRTDRRRLPGFDCAFRAPKSVSVLYALGDQATAAVVRDAHDQAVEAAVGYLQQHAGVARRGRDRQQVPVDGLVAAAFRHRTSRAGDPLLHTHVLVANVGRCPDGQWRALDGRAVYTHAKTAGYLYQAALRDQLTRRLGVQWTPVRNGVADLAGVPREVIEAFSRRRADILDRMAEQGGRSAKAAQAATLDTRRAKDRTRPAVALHAQWTARAAELSFTTDQLASVLGVAQPTPRTPDDLVGIAQRIAGPQGLTARASTFTRRDVIRAWCEQLEAGASVEQILGLTDALLAADSGLVVELLPAAASCADSPVEPAVAALVERLDPASAEQLRRSEALRDSLTTILEASGWSAQQAADRLVGRGLDSAQDPDGVLVWRARQLARALTGDRTGAQPGADRSAVIRRADGHVVRADPAERRYSTPELLALEQRLVEAAVARRDAQVAQAPGESVDAALARRPSIAGEQADMVRRLTTSGAGVEVVVGKAGAGKTFALDAARDAWQTAGVRVVGAALAARAAAELQAGAGIDSYTVDALLGALDRPGPATGLERGSVLVVDEAAMVGTRKLAQLLAHAQSADAKLLLVGDHRQMPEIDAGGVFRGLCHRLQPITLEHNRRQHHRWERAALDQLRSGDPAAAVAAYSAGGRLVIGPTADAVREQLVDDWWQARQATGPHAGVMIAAHLSDVDDLNQRARARLAQAGDLTGPALTAAGRDFRRGDHIMMLNNDRRLGVLNGTRAAVTDADPDRRALHAIADDGRQLRLPAAYLDAGHVTHGYAITGHKAQGITTDRAWILGSDEIYREWGYVALSRGREANRLYIVADERTFDGDEHCHGGLEAAVDPLAALAHDLERSRTQSLAMDQTGGGHTPAPGSATGSDQQREQLLRLFAAAPPDPGRPLGWALEERDAAIDHLEAARRRHDAAFNRLHAVDSVVARLSRRETITRARADVERTAADLARWHTRLSDSERRVHDLEAAQGERDAWLEQHAAEIAQGEDLARALSAAARRRAHQAELAQPGYLLASVGRRPDDPTERRAWRQAVAAIERYRARYAIQHPQLALGDPPTDPDQRLDHDRAAIAISGVQAARDRTLTHHPGRDDSLELAL